jgi:hypothetical protein
MCFLRVHFIFLLFSCLPAVSHHAFPARDHSSHTTPIQRRQKIKRDVVEFQI